MLKRIEHLCYFCYKTYYKIPFKFKLHIFPYIRNVIIQDVNKYTTD